MSKPLSESVFNRGKKAATLGTARKSNVVVQFSFFPANDLTTPSIAEFSVARAVKSLSLLAVLRPNWSPRAQIRRTFGQSPGERSREIEGHRMYFFVPERAGTC